MNDHPVRVEEARLRPRDELLAMLDRLVSEWMESGPAVTHTGRERLSALSEAAERIRADARPHQVEAQGSEPVAWRVKDFADMWVLYPTEERARRYAANSGALVQPLYMAPPSLGMEGVRATKDEAKVLERAGYTRSMDITEALMGPHEWGYRDPVVGGFVEDRTPFAAAELIAHLRERFNDAVQVAGMFRTNARVMRGEKGVKAWSGDFVEREYQAIASISPSGKGEGA